MRSTRSNLDAPAFFPPLCSGERTYTYIYIYSQFRIVFRTRLTCIKYSHDEENYPNVEK